MISVYVHRDSVAMGDDVEAHVHRWEFDDDVRIGEILVRMIEGYLAHVAGPIAWTVSIGDEPVVMQHDDYRTVSSKSETQLAVVFVDRDEVSISQLHRRWGGRSLLSVAARPNADGEYFIRADYLSNGAAVPIGQYREWIAKTYEQLHAENVAFRARAYPRLYDENGNRRRT